MKLLSYLLTDLRNTTQIRINRKDLNSLDDKNLGRICIEPTIHMIRGKNLIVKSEVYSQLTSGQKSLLMFWILFGHARHGIIQFFNEIDYLLSGKDIWTEFIDRFKCFEDDNLLELINEMKCLYQEYVKVESKTNSEFRLSVLHLDKRYSDIIPNSVKMVGKYIRNNPNEFIHSDA